MFSNILTKISCVFVIIGALNWGLVGLFDWNLVAALFGVGTFLTRLIYILVGLCGIWLITGGFSRSPKLTRSEKL